MAAENVCPSRAFRGCPSGERTALYSRIADAPYTDQSGKLYKHQFYHLRMKR
jgi:hypothetical protein